jgi:hypothetical protein
MLFERLVRPIRVTNQQTARARTQLKEEEIEAPSVGDREATDATRQQPDELVGKRGARLPTR